MPQNELFNLSTIGKIGELEVSFDEQLNACVRDCMERASLGKDREVILKVRCRPNTQELDEVDVECEVSSKVPTRKIDTYRMLTTSNGGLRFQPDLPDDPDQSTLDFLDSDDDGE